jgi:hypothetical protein
MDLRKFLKGIVNAPSMDVEIRLITPDGNWVVADMVAAGNVIYLRAWDKESE